MDAITLQNYRCFGSEEQTARLAPLTLLVGPNSTGKTSFLALVRALWDLAFRSEVPNFREEPYDLGSFEDIAHWRGRRRDLPDSFTVGFQYTPPDYHNDRPIRFDASFASRRAAPFPVWRRFADQSSSIEIPEKLENEPQQIHWKVNESGGSQVLDYGGLPRLSGELFAVWRFVVTQHKGETGFWPDDDSASQLRALLDAFAYFWTIPKHPLAFAPVQSRPLRTYDPMQLVVDPSGASVPSYLAGLFRSDANEWQQLKRAMDAFGQAAGLFDEIGVKSFGNSDGDPFQIQFRKYGKRRKGPWRNLIDVGYGVSQALPLLVELLKANESPMPAAQSPMLLLQQPEVHLHPQAEAALGTLFCSAATSRQLLVETHSDYIIDRVRMDVRDETTGLKPEDVSILYFEPGDLEVKIHNIRLDQMGNVLDAPPSYGAFFMAEVDRSIGLVKPSVRHT